MIRNLEKVWTRILGRKSWVRARGSFREKERHGLIARPNYAYGMLRAADVASYFGKKKTTVCEFGVAEGNGLLNMIDLAKRIEGETGIGFRVVGFDTAAGLPPLSGYKDHPEIWSPGDFPMFDKDALLKKIGDQAELIIGDIAETIDAFTASLESEMPLGFASIDVDIYSAARSALKCLLARSEVLAPAVSLYFDDVGFFFANEYCGELAAISEFNDGQALRKLGLDKSLPGGRPSFEAWHRHMYVCHVLDHSLRNLPRRRNQMSIGRHHEFMKASNLY